MNDYVKLGFGSASRPPTRVVLNKLANSMSRSVSTYSMVISVNCKESSLIPMKTVNSYNFLFIVLNPRRKLAANRELPPRILDNTLNLKAGYSDYESGKDI